jgi:2-keto-4-pentenoate hydratase/2-oxohepta-3-ene-1,7-dioic acid hydratase in catechol pathway
MRLATYRDDGVERLGVLVDERMLDVRVMAERRLGVAPSWSESMLAFLRAGPGARRELEELLSRRDGAEGPFTHALSEIELLAPVPRPESLRDAMSFERHVLQATRAAGLGPLARLDEVVERVLGPRRTLSGLLNREFYVQPPHYRSNDRSVVGPDAEVRIPKRCRKFDYELEWGVFIGVEGRDIPASRAAEHIAGYTIFNDFSARDIQLAEMRSRLGPAKGKNFDTGNAMGPYLVTPGQLDDPYNLVMRARVNGEEWSRGNTGEAYWRFEQLIEHISRDETLYPGDFIGSGTCSGAGGMGCGLEQGRFLSPGDVVELEVQGIGVLRNRVVGASEG